jgi:tetratricopeptide (TPR) repeat protein
MNGFSSATRGHSTGLRHVRRAVLFSLLVACFAPTGGPSVCAQARLDALSRQSLSQPALEELHRAAEARSQIDRWFSQRWSDGAESAGTSRRPPTASATDNEFAALIENLAAQGSTIESRLLDLETRLEQLDFRHHTAGGDAVDNQPHSVPMPPESAETASTSGAASAQPATESGAAPTGSEHDSHAPAPAGAGEAIQADHPAAGVSRTVSWTQPSDPVDPLRLADNLLVADQLEFALPIFLRAIDDPETAKEDRLWAQYQTAVCYRRQENWTEAETRFRELANSSADEDIAAMAQWWLQAIGRRKSLEATAGQLDQTIDALRKVIHANNP